jgi:hypothetical protein
VRLVSSMSARSYEIQRKILAGLSEAQRGWERETGARLVVSSRPPYFRYVGHDRGRTKGAA